MRKVSILILTASSLLIASSFPMAYFAYLRAGSSSFNLYETLSSFIFWVPVVSLALWFPLRSTVMLFVQYMRTSRGKLLFASYTGIHLILYGYLLQMILVYAHKLPDITSQPSVYFGSTLQYPAFISAIITSYGYYPNISILIPPSFNLVWSFYSVSLALIIGILVVTNVLQVVDLGNICALVQKTRAFIFLPVTGVIVGATCCVSFPVLISLASLFAAIFSDSAAFLTAYFLLPCAAGIALNYNLESTNRMATDIQRLKKSLNSSIKGLR
jgi:hypothetical protein